MLFHDRCVARFLTDPVPNSLISFAVGSINFCANACWSVSADD